MAAIFVYAFACAAMVFLRIIRNQMAKKAKSLLKAKA